MGMREPLAPKEYYHLYNRGTDKRRIFDTRGDYQRFLGLLYLSNGTEPIQLSNHRGSTLPEWLEMEKGEPLVDVGAYCLMPNHFHLLVRQREEGGISRFMQKLTTAYTMYFNTKNERTGSLFQGKYKSQHGKDDRYLKYLISYIHLNPVKLFNPKWREVGITNSAKAKLFLDRYDYSSYLDYSGTSRLENKIITADSLPQYWNGPREFKKEILEWLLYNELVDTKS